MPTLTTSRYAHGGAFFPVHSHNLLVHDSSYYLLTYLPVLVLRQVRELASSRDLEGVLDMPRRDGTRIRL